MRFSKRLPSAILRFYIESARNHYLRSTPGGKGEKLTCTFKCADGAQLFRVVGWVDLDGGGRKALFGSETDSYTLEWAVDAC